jgi:hypothetical protein
MAITIHQQPDEHSAISTPLIITASSSNSSNDGFKYVVRLDIAGKQIRYIVSPNPNDYLVFNIVSSVTQFMRNISGNLDQADADGSVHSMTRGDQINISEAQAIVGNAGFQDLSVTIWEAWNVDGVFTIEDASETTLSLYLYNFLDFTTRDGYKPSLLARIGHEDGDQSRLMSDRLPSTYYWQYAASVGLNLDNTIYIPVRESDWGVWDIRQSVGGESVVADQAQKIFLSILPNSGPPVQQVYDLANEEAFSHIPVYPANLNASTLADIIKPQDYPNWKAIYFQIINNDGDIVSMTYVMFNVDRQQTGICNCHDYTPIRLAWVGRRGGWEYHNFNMLSEQEYATEQKVSKRIVGNYGDVTEGVDFTFNTFDESERVVYKKIDKFITCSTDKLQQGEWEFLKGLILSKQVHWVHDDGTHTPVIVQDSNIRVRNINAKTLEPLTIRIKVAQDQPN